MSDPDWRVRHETVDRLIARGRDDDRTLPVLLNAATTDEAWQVRDAVVMRLHEFDRDAVLLVLRGAENDEVGDVRWSARYVVPDGTWPAPRLKSGRRIGPVGVTVR
jgi:HEAT repeat protein